MLNERKWVRFKIFGKHERKWVRLKIFGKHVTKSFMTAIY